MPARKGLLAPQNTFLDTIATRFDGTHSNFVLGNAKIAINPIVYCSDGFCDLTGYSRAHIMQKSCACNFLYGPRTDFRHKEAISRALEQKQELKLEVILYKRSQGSTTATTTANSTAANHDARTPFWCLLDIVPIQDEKHEVVLFLCSHKDITKQKWHEEKEHELARLKQLKQLAHRGPALVGRDDPLPETAATPAITHDGSAQARDRSGSDSTHLDATADSTTQQPPQQNSDNQPQKQHQHHQATEAAAADKLQLAQVEDVDDEELTALANQNALISMDEFRLENCVGDDDNEFDDDSEDDADHDKHTANQYSRRRSRAVLYQLSGHYGNRRSVNMKSKLKLNNRMNIPEYKTTTIEKQRFILSHYGIGKTCWDWLILVVSFYVAIVVPYNATFNDKQQDLISGAGKIDSIDIIVEVVFIIDVILNFRTTFVNRKGEVVTRPKIICRHYLRGWFMVDACAAVPFDLLCGLNIYDRSILKVDLNLLKLIRLLRLARLLQKMDRYSQYSYIILTLLILIFSLLAHWCACIWYVIAMKEIDAHPDWKIGWIHQLSDKLGYSVINATDLASSYVTALYFTTSSLTSVGFGNVSANTNAEKIFSIVIMLIGALMHAVVFGNVTALIRVMYARRSNYQTRLRDLKDFFRLHQLPKELQQRMSDYFQTTWSLNHGIETSEILKDFPEELRGDVSLHLHHEVLSLPIFETAPQGFLKQLARHIESKFCCPTEYLIHRRDALNYLYLVCNGSMEVLQDNMVVAILGKGDLVGYDVSAHIVPPQQQQHPSENRGSGKGQTTLSTVSSAMGGLVKSSSDLKALTYCDLKCIHISGLLEVLKLYPEFSDTFHREIIHDLSFNLRESLEDHATDDTTEEDEDDDDDDDDDDEEVEGEDGDGDDDDEDEDDGGEQDDDDDHRHKRGRNHQRALITSPESILDNGRGGEDTDDGSDGRHAAAGQTQQQQTTTSRVAASRRSPPPSIGHLYRSITGSGGGGGENHNQIGRYDHDIDQVGCDNDIDADIGDANILQEELDEEEEEEDDEELEEEESADSNNSNGTNIGYGRDNDNTDNDRGGAGGAATGGLSALNGKAGDTNETKTANGHSSGEKNDQQQQQQQQQQRREQNGRAGGWSNNIVRQQQPVLRRRLTGTKETPVRRRRSSCSDLDEDDQVDKGEADWQSAHSDEGRLQMSTEEVKKPHATVDDNMLNQGSFAGKPLRSAILGGPSMRVAKPPISFDLSRNTTAIVDRRRRSAGCIPRALLQGASNSVIARANHSSLIHINEEPQDHETPEPVVPTKVKQRDKTQRQVNNNKGPDRHLSELKRIDTRINGLEASVSEMRKEIRRELKSELHSIKSAIEQLITTNTGGRDHQANRSSSSSSSSNKQKNSNNHHPHQHRRQNSFQSTTCHSRKPRRSSGGPISHSSTDVRGSSVSCLLSSSLANNGQYQQQLQLQHQTRSRQSKSASFNILPTSSTDNQVANNKQQKTASGLKKSQSSSSFKQQTTSSRNGTGTSHRLSITSDQHAMLVGFAKQYMTDLATTQGGATPTNMLVSLPPSGSGDYVTTTTFAMPMQAQVCNQQQQQQQQQPNQASIRQSSSGVNFSNTSDNDSGRSSSSVNSSMNIAGLQRTGAVPAIGTGPKVTNVQTNTWSRQQQPQHTVVQVAAENRDTLAGGRAAKMLLTSATRESADGKQMDGYIIDLDT